MATVSKLSPRSTGCLSYRYPIRLDRVHGLNNVAGYAHHGQDRDHDRDPEGGPLELVSSIECKLFPRPRSFVE
jgi:hypothetical protein